MKKYLPLLLILVMIGSLAAEVVPFRNSGLWSSSANNNPNSTESKSGRKISKNKLMRFRDNKSPLIAAGLSLLLPGAGEVYGEEYWRAAIFAGIEIATLSAYYVNAKDGDDKTDKFEDFANAHFDENQYYGTIWQMVEDSLTAYQPYNALDEDDDGYGNYHLINNVKDWSFGEIINPDFWDPNEDDIYGIADFWAMACETEKISHQLPSSKTQQYYEMIGKYEQFKAGWDDYTGFTGETRTVYAYNRDINGNITDSTAYEIKVLNPNAKGSIYFTKNSNYYSTRGNNTYMDMRDEANKAYELGQTFIMATLLNHVASAFDAQFVINRKYRIKTKLRIEDNAYNQLDYNNYKITYSVNF